MALSDLLLLTAIVLVLAILGSGGYVLMFRKRFSFLKRPYPETGGRLSKRLGIPSEAPEDATAERAGEYFGSANRIPEFATGVMEVARDLTPGDHGDSSVQTQVVPGVNPAKKTIVIPGESTAPASDGAMLAVPRWHGAHKIRRTRIQAGVFSSGDPGASGQTGPETWPLTNRAPTTEQTGMEIAAEFPVAGSEPSAAPLIPWSYGECRITALVRDPYWLFAYWEIDAAKREEIARRYGDQAWDESWPVLRVYDVTNLYFFDSRHYTEISSNDYTNNWYIRTGQPNSTFCIELGRVHPDGSYIFLARSNFVSTPRDRVSDVVDEEWLLLPEYAARLSGRIGGSYPGPSSPGSMGPAEYLSSPGLMQPGGISSPMKW
jgi:hypothetical protein